MSETYECDHCHGPTIHETKVCGLCQYKQAMAERTDEYETFYVDGEGE